MNFQTYMNIMEAMGGLNAGEDDIYNEIRGGAPKGMVPPQLAPRDQARLYADLMVYEQGVDTVLIGPQVKFTSMFRRYLHFCGCYDLELFSACAALAELAERGHRGEVQAALDEREGCIEALVMWTFRTPRIKDASDNSPFPGEGLRYSDPRYRAAPQTDPKYAEVMCIGPLPLLLLVVRSKRLLQRVLAAPEYPGLIERLDELSSRRQAAFSHAAELARSIRAKLAAASSGTPQEETHSSSAASQGKSKKKADKSETDRHQASHTAGTGDADEDSDILAGVRVSAPRNMCWSGEEPRQCPAKSDNYPAPMQDTSTSTASTATVIQESSKNQLGDQEMTVSKACDWCGALKTPSGGKLKKCAGCSVYRYCSLDCQNAAWKRHRPECQRLRQQAKDAA